MQHDKTELPSRRAPSPRLSPAEVVEVVGDDDVLVRMGTGYVLRAEIALAGYTPRVGDRVLVGDDAAGAWVLGLLGDARRRSPELAHGKLVATFRDGEGVVLRAIEGGLSLEAPDKVSITSSEISVDAGRLVTRAERIIEEADATYRSVRDVAELVAGRTRTLVDGACEVHAERTTITSSGDTVLDGARVLLG